MNVTQQLKKRVDVALNFIQGLVYTVLVGVTGYTIIDYLLSGNVGWNFSGYRIGWLNILMLYGLGILLTTILYEYEKLKSDAERISNYMNLFTLVFVLMLSVGNIADPFGEGYMFWSSIALFCTSFFGLLHSFLFEEYIVETFLMNDEHFPPPERWSGEDDEAEEQPDEGLSEAEIWKSLFMLIKAFQKQEHLNELQSRFQLLSHRDRQRIKEVFPDKIEYIFNEIFLGNNPEKAAVRIRHKKFGEVQMPKILEIVSGADVVSEKLTLTPNHTPSFLTYSQEDPGDTDIDALFSELGEEDFPPPDQDSDMQINIADLEL